MGSFCSRGHLEKAAWHSVDVFLLLTPRPNRSHGYFTDNPRVRNSRSPKWVFCIPFPSANGASESNQIRTLLLQERGLWIRPDISWPPRLYSLGCKENFTRRQKPCRSAERKMIHSHAGNQWWTFIVGKEKRETVRSLTARPFDSNQILATNVDEWETEANRLFSARGWIELKRVWSDSFGVLACNYCIPPHHSSVTVFHLKHIILGAHNHTLILDALQNIHLT